MSDHVPPVPPAPRYGEYAPPGYVGSPAPQTPPPGYVASPPRKRRTWDIVLTIVLIVLGFFGMLAGLGYAAVLASPGSLDEVLRQQGYGGFTGDAAVPAAVMAISHVVLFIIALGLSIPLLVRGRIVVFWIPLVAGVIAAVFFWGALFSALLSDPAFVERVGG